MALTLEQEKALLALLDGKRITLPELTAATEIYGSDLFLTNQMLADKSVTADVLKQFVSPDATLTRKGITQLSNQIDSHSESEAATPKAVKQAYDLTHAKLAEGITSKHINATETMKIRGWNAVTSVAGVGAENDGNVRLAPENIGAVSQVNADNRYLRLENAPDFVILYPGGTEAEPALITVNQKIVIDNPFSGHKVSCTVEIMDSLGIWTRAFYSAHNTNRIWNYGVVAAQINDSIVITASSSALLQNGYTPNFSGFTTTVTTAKVRLLVWNIK